MSTDRPPTTNLADVSRGLADPTPIPADAPARTFPPHLRQWVDFCCDHNGYGCGHHIDGHGRGESCYVRGCPCTVWRDHVGCDHRARDAAERDARAAIDPKPEREIDMMDLEPLREAARLIRERAAAATPSPWKATDNNSIEAQAGFRGRVVASVGAYESGWPSAADARHIASWHPAVVQSIADWLDTGANPYSCVDREPMFRVAHAYLGTQP